MMKFYLLAALLLSSCGQEHAPYGRTQDYLSERQRLYITAGKDGGFCVHSVRRSGKGVLITGRGALTAEQLGRSLSYMSYWSQTASSALPTAGWGYAWVRFLRKSADVFEESQLAKELTEHGRARLMKAGLGLVVVLVAVNAANGLYRIIKGNLEGEGGGAIAAQFFFGWMPFNYLVEDVQRRGRLETLANRYELQNISTRKMNSIIKKLSRQQPAFPNGC